MESIELLLQMVVEEPILALNVDLENDTAAWVRDCTTTHVHRNNQIIKDCLTRGEQLLQSSQLCFLLGEAVPAESPGVQQAAGSLEQVSW